MMKFLSSLDRYYPFLTESDLISISQVNKEFSISAIEKLKEINSSKLKDAEREKNFLKTKYESDCTKEITAFSLTRGASKAVSMLNEEKNFSIIEKNQIILRDDIIFVYRLMYQLINKNENLILNFKKKFVDKEEYWNLVREDLLKNSGDKKIGDYLDGAFKNLDFSDENVFRVKNFCDGHVAGLNGSHISKVDNTTGLLFFLVKDALEYIGILFTKKTQNAVIFKALEYCILKRKENNELLDKILKRLNE